MQGQGAYILMLATILAGMAACGGTGGRLEPFAPGSVKVGGEIGRRMAVKMRGLTHMQPSPGLTHQGERCFSRP